MFYVTFRVKQLCRVCKSSDIVSLVKRRRLLNPAEVPQPTSAITDDAWEW